MDRRGAFERPSVTCTSFTPVIVRFGSLRRHWMMRFDLKLPINQWPDMLQSSQDPCDSHTILNHYSACPTGFNFILKTGISVCTGFGENFAGAAFRSQAMYSLPSFICCFPPVSFSLSVCKNTNSFFKFCSNSLFLRICSVCESSFGFFLVIKLSLMSWNSGVRRARTLGGGYWYSTAEERLV